MIAVTSGKWTSRKVILKNGCDAGMIENGKAYAQGLTLPELRELVRVWEECEYLEKKAGGKKVKS